MEQKLFCVCGCEMFELNWYLPVSSEMVSVCKVSFLYVFDLSWWILKVFYRKYIVGPFLGASVMVSF